MVRHAQRPYVAIMAVCLALRLALVIPAAVYGGLVAAAAMMALTAIINAGLWFSYLRGLLGMRWRHFAAPAWRSFAAAGVMVVAVVAAEYAWPLRDSIALLQWIGFSSLGAVIHIAVQFSLWAIQGKPAGPEIQLLSRLVRRPNVVIELWYKLGPY